MDQDQTAPVGAVSSGSTLFVIGLLKHFSRREKQTNFVLISALRVKEQSSEAETQFGNSNYNSDLGSSEVYELKNYSSW